MSDETLEVLDKLDNFLDNSKMQDGVPNEFDLGCEAMILKVKAFVAELKKDLQNKEDEQI